MKTHAFHLLICLLFVQTSNSQSENLAAYDRLNIIGPTISDQASNLVSTGFTRGPGLEITNGSDKFNSKDWNGPRNLSQAISADNYVQWSVEGDANFAIELEELSINLSRNNNGPTQWIIQYSFDEFSSTGINLIGVQTLSGNDSINSFNFSGLSVSTTFGNSITFRLYAWSARNPSGRLAIEGDTSQAAFSIGNPGVVIGGTILFDGIVYSSGSWSPYPPSETTISDNAWVKDGLYSEASGVQLNSLIINPDASVFIEKSGSLQVVNSIVTNDGLTLFSDSDEYSSLLANSVDGLITYERHVNVNASVGQNDLIAPMVSGQTFGAFADENPNIFENPNNTTQKLFGPFDKSSGRYLTYDTVNNELTPLTLGVGYRAASTDNGNFRFTGTVLTDALSTPIFFSGPGFQEWNLIGNPYPSYLKLSDFLNENNSQFIPDCAGIYGYDGLASDGWTVWNLAFALANPNAQVTPGQGFLVASKAGGGSISFLPSMRSLGPGDDFILGRQASNENDAIEWLTLQLRTGMHDSKTSIYMTDRASMGLDVGYDTGVFNQTAPEFSIYSRLPEDPSGTDFAIQSINLSDLKNKDAVIPIGIHIENGSRSTVSLLDFSLSEHTTVLLEDRKNNQFTDLRTKDYVVEASSNLSGSSNFYLHIGNKTLSTDIESLVKTEINYISRACTLNIKNFSSSNYKLQIFDINGNKKFESIGAADGDLKFDLSNKRLFSGIYIVELTSSSGVDRKKIAVL